MESDSLGDTQNPVNLAQRKLNDMILAEHKLDMENENDSSGHTGNDQHECQRRRLQNENGSFSSTLACSRTACDAFKQKNNTLKLAEEQRDRCTKQRRAAEQSSKDLCTEIRMCSEYLFSSRRTLFHQNILGFVGLYVSEICFVGSKWAFVGLEMGLRWLL
jgi:hypothetical protein